MYVDIKSTTNKKVSFLLGFLLQLCTSTYECLKEVENLRKFLLLKS